MPRENINCSAMPGFRAEVSWTRDGYVQVATVNTDSKATIPGENPGDPSQPLDGWRVTLDRVGLNKLIRDARHARDQAYGPDA